LVAETISEDLKELVSDDEFVKEEGSVEIMNALRVVATFYGGPDYA
jgi:hypothetical protein